MGNEATSLITYQNVVLRPLYEVAHSIQCVENALQATMTERISRVALVAVTLHFTMDDGRAGVSADMLAQSIAYYFENLRCLVRKTDVVYILNSTFYFLLLNANSEGGSIVQTRLWDALLWRVHNTNEQEILRPCMMSIGNAAYPDPFSDAAECVAAASNPQYSMDLQPERAKRKVSLPKASVSQEIPTGRETSGQEEELTALACKLGVPYLSLLPRKKVQYVQRMIALHLMHELQCYPLGRERGVLTVALANPEDSSVLTRLQEATGLRIFPVLTHPQELQAALSQLV
jgi:hypothetical protein